MLHRDDRCTHYHDQFVQDADGTICSSACTTVPQSPCPFYLKAQGAGRRFTEKERVVLIYKTLVEPRSLEHDEPIDGKYAEVSVYILTPANDSGDGCAEPATTIEMWSSMARWSRNEMSASDEPPTVGDTIARRMWIQTLKYRRELVEEFLVDAINS